MAVYLIHLNKPIGDLNNPRGKAQHYIGWASDLANRIKYHRNGNGARLIQVVNAAGVGWEVVRTWPEGDKTLERRLKNWHKASQLCPVCNPERWQRTEKSNG